MKKLLFVLLFSFFLNPNTIAQSNYPPKINSDKTIIFKKTETVDLKLWVFNPKQATGKDPAIVFFFGGGWHAGTPAQFIEQAKFLSSRGMVSIIADYRVFSRDKIRAKFCISDAKSAIRWVRKNAKNLGIDENKIVSSGGSAGGHLAAATGTVPYFDEEFEDQSISSKPNAMILFNPGLITSSIDGFPINDERLKNTRIRIGDDPIKASPYHYINKNTVPTIIFHGLNDKTIPYQTVELYDKKMKELGNISELHLYEGEDHGFFNYGRNSNIAFDDTMDKTYRFLKKIKFLE